MTKPGDIWRSKCGRMILRCGRWQDVLSDVERVDAVITDPPYSERTHKGERGLRISRETNAKYVSDGLSRCPRNAIAYSPLTRKECKQFTSFVVDRVKHWSIIFCDHNTFNWWQSELSENNWTTFAPVVWAKKAAPPRFSGDGPANWCEYISVARPKKRVKRSGSRPGYYLANTQTGRLDDAGGTGIVGRKHVEALAKIVSDYSEPNDLILDPYCGSGSLLRAAAIEGRRAIGAEMDPKTFDLAVRRLEAGYTPTMF